jgi:hypothetical protein
MTSQTDRKTEQTETSLKISPEYERYREGEESIKHLRFRLDAGWSTDRSRTTDAEYWVEYEHSDVALVADIESEWKRYFRPNHFFALSAEGSGTHRLLHSEERGYNRDEEVKDRTHNKYNAALRIGFGFGRVRDVTPVVRALRLGERLAALGRVARLSDGEVQGVAEHFARRSGYSRVYDRSNKYFWDDLAGIVAGIDSLSAFEAHYLSEVFAEKAGDRLEGWNAAAGLGLTSSDYYVPNRNAVLSGFVLSSWYKNHTLDHQTGLGAKGEIGRHIDGNADLGQEGFVRLYANHLWVIVDRLVWEPEVSGTVYFTKVEETQDREAWWKTSQYYSLTSALTFYIEDRVALTSRGTFRIQRSDRESNRGERYVRHDTDWYVRISLTYYLDRALSL